MNFNVYLSGPIAGLNWDQIAAWRNELRPLVDSNIRLISPMRGKEHQKKTVKKYHKIIADNKDTTDIMATGKSIFNAIGSKSVSIGSVCEVAWAWQLGKIVVFAIDDNPKNPHNHDFIHTMAHYTVHNLPDAAYVLNQIFIGYRK
jgi:hypothetical protein